MGPGPLDVRRVQVVKQDPARVTAPLQPSPAPAGRPQEFSGVASLLRRRFWRGTSARRAANARRAIGVLRCRRPAIYIQLTDWHNSVCIQPDASLTTNRHWGPGAFASRVSSVASGEPRASAIATYQES